MIKLLVFCALVALVYGQHPLHTSPCQPTDLDCIAMDKYFPHNARGKKQLVANSRLGLDKELVEDEEDKYPNCYCFRDPCPCNPDVKKLINGYPDPLERVANAQKYEFRLHLLASSLKNIDNPEFVQTVIPHLKTFAKLPSTGLTYAQEFQAFYPGNPYIDDFFNRLHYNYLYTY